MEVKEESTKVGYKDGVPTICFMQNGSLKMYRLVEASYADIDVLFDKKL